jgi:crotonobetainyl-CoA:carnitine CoA-transferase CaiB-like acyl-CoA transferase
VAHREDLKARLEELLASRGADDWQRQLTQAGVPCGPINDLAQAFELASALGLEPVVEVEGTPTVAHPITLSRTPATYRSGPPDLPSD